MLGLTWPEAILGIVITIVAGWIVVTLIKAISED
jgi:hypothetical protein